MSSQDLIQKRSVDPFSTAESNIVNNKQAALVGSITKGVLKDGEVTFESNTFVAIKPGFFLKDRVTIHLTEKLRIDCSSFNDGFYFVVLDYTYDKVIPVPTAEFKVITLNDYLTDSDRYLFLAEMRMDSGSISYVVYETTNGTVNEKRQLITYGNHNSLENIQGGSVNSYFHLTEDQFNALSSIASNPITSHETLSGLQGGDANGHFHLTSDEYVALQYVLDGDLDSYHMTSFSLNGGGIIADKLNGFDSSDFALVNHNHYHGQLLNKQGEGDYHLTAQEFDSYTDIIDNYEDQVPDTTSFDGKDSDDFALADHNHEHNSLLGLQGGLLNEYYHLSENEYTSLLNLLEDPQATFNNAEHLELHDDSYFAFSDHTHSHNNLLNLQGGKSGEYYHLLETEWQTLRGIEDGSIPAPNSSKLNDVTADGYSQANHTHEHSYLRNKQGNGEYHVSSTYYDALTNQNFPPTASNYFLTVSEFNTLFSGYQGSSGYDHNATVGIQGGDATTKEHATEFEYEGLVTGIDTTLHNHDSLYYSIALSDANFINVSGDSFLTNANLDLSANLISSVLDPNATSSEAPHVYGAVSKHFVDVALAASFTHNGLGGVQGEVNGDAYHVTDAQYTFLQSGIPTTIHNHNSLYYDKNNMPITSINGDTMSGDLSMGGNNIKELPLAVDDSDIVTKELLLNYINLDVNIYNTTLFLWDQYDFTPTGFSFIENQKTYSFKGINYALSREVAPSGPFTPSTPDLKVRAEGVVIDQNTVGFFFSDLQTSANLSIFSHDISGTDLAGDSSIVLNGPYGFGLYLVSNIIVIDGMGYFIAYVEGGHVPSGPLFHLYEFSVSNFMDPSSYNVAYSFRLSEPGTIANTYFVLKNGALNNDSVNLFSDYDSIEYDSVNGDKFSNLGFIKRLDCFRLDSYLASNGHIQVYRFEKEGSSWTKSLETIINLPNNFTVSSILPFSLSAEASYYQIIYNQTSIKTVDINTGNFYDTLLDISEANFSSPFYLIAVNNSNGKYSERALVYDPSLECVQDVVIEQLGTTSAKIVGGVSNTSSNLTLDPSLINIINCHFFCSSDRSIQYLIYIDTSIRPILVHIYKIYDVTSPMPITTTKKYRMLKYGDSINGQKALYYITKNV